MAEAAKRKRSKQPLQNLPAHFGEPLLNPSEAALYLSISADTLRRWRWLGEGPVFCKIGGAVRYRKADLDSYVQKVTRQSGEVQ